MNSDLINRQDAIDALIGLDISDGVGISCIASGVQYSAIRAIEDLPSAGSERMHDIMDYTRYQVEWLESHNDIELEPELEKWIVRMLNDTAECYIKEHPESERKTGEWMPFTSHESDAEEKEMHPDYDCILDGPLPEDGQEILVTITCAGHERVQADEFYSDDGCYLDSGYELVTEAVAWMPLPEPYAKRRTDG